MVIKYIKGDITTYKSEKLTLICHIVNYDCINGSGVTVALNSKWGFLKELAKFYRELVWDHQSFSKDVEPFYQQVWQLGQVHFYKSGNVVIASMLSQTSPGGFTIDGVYLRPIRLDCLEECMLRVREFAKMIGCDTIVCPKFGGLRAGADFEKEIEPMIKKYWEAFQVTIYEYKE